MGMTFDQVQQATHAVFRVAKMLMDQADKCDGIAADIERLREIKEAA